MNNGLALEPLAELGFNPLVAGSRGVQCRAGGDGPAREVSGGSRAVATYQTI